ncbi:MAG TPA: SGNH/GDSL hydrolase family protein [Bryobacteraceae bacterium]|nr:SGNH/GDSL hydrolase family protein [Bryobacteraceae bacterium]
MTPRTRTALLVLFAAIAVVPPIEAGQIDAIYAFGDSLTDVGNAFIATGGAIPGAPYFNGEFSNGPIWIQDLAAGLGLAPLTPSLGGGTDFAVGGADTGSTPYHAANLSDLLSPGGQIASFELTHPAADPNALYTIWIGANDVRDILATLPTAPQAAADIAAAVSNIDTAINDLAASGAKNFLIVTVPDLGLTPASTEQIPPVSAAASAISLDLDNTLVNGSGPIPSLSSLAALTSTHISELNTFSLLDAIVSDPAAYGITNVTDPCLTGSANFSGGTPCPTPNQYLFWDIEHPTAAADQFVAAAALGLVTPEPSSITLLAAGLFGLALVGRRRR